MSEGQASPTEQTRISFAAVLSLALVVLLVLLALANTRRVEISWLVGSTHASLVWVIAIAAALGWLLGLSTPAIRRHRQRRRR